MMKGDRKASLRSTIHNLHDNADSADNEKRQSAVFDMVDTDGSGTIDSTEFGKLYQLIKLELVEEHKKEEALALRVARQKRRLRVAGVLAIVMMLFLGLSVATNAVVMFNLLESTKETKATDGKLVTKGTNLTVQTASTELSVATNVDDGSTYLNSKDGDAVLTVASADVAVGEDAAGETVLQTKTGENLEVEVAQNIEEVDDATQVFRLFQQSKYRADFNKYSTTFDATGATVETELNAFDMRTFGLAYNSSNGNFTLPTVAADYNLKFELITYHTTHPDFPLLVVARVKPHVPDLDEYTVTLLDEQAFSGDYLNLVTPADAAIFKRVMHEGAGTLGDIQWAEITPAFAISGSGRRLSHTTGKSSAFGSMNGYTYYNPFYYRSSFWLGKSSWFSSFWSNKRAKGENGKMRKVWPLPRKTCTTTYVYSYVPSYGFTYNWWTGNYQFQLTYRYISTPVRTCSNSIRFSKTYPIRKPSKKGSRLTTFTIPKYTFPNYFVFRSRELQEGQQEGRELAHAGTTTYNTLEEAIEAWAADSNTDAEAANQLSESFCECWENQWQAANNLNTDDWQSISEDLTGGSDTAGVTYTTGDAFDQFFEWMNSQDYSRRRQLSARDSHKRGRKLGADSSCPSDGRRQCHPAHATLELESGAHKRIDQVAVGELVRTPSGFEPVTGFLHADKDTHASYFVFKTADTTMAISEKHWLFVDGIEMDPALAAVGQTLDTTHGAQPILSITKEKFDGAYHLFTASGAYYVDGVAASTYPAYIPHGAWKLVGDAYVSLRYKLGLPVVPEGQAPVTLFWLLDALRAAGVSDETASFFFWPFIATSVIATEVASAVAVALSAKAAPFSVLAVGLALTPLAHKARMAAH